MHTNEIFSKFKGHRGTKWTIDLFCTCLHQTGNTLLLFYYGYQLNINTILLLFPNWAFLCVIYWLSTDETSTEPSSIALNLLLIL